MKTILTSALTAFAFTGALAFAAMAPVAMAPAAAQQQTAAFSDDDVRSYAAAAVEVQELGRKWQPEIEAAESDEAASEARAEAQSEMVEAIKDEGLTIEQYNAIFTAAQSDPALQAKISDYAADEMN